MSARLLASVAVVLICSGCAATPAAKAPPAPHPLIGKRAPAVEGALVGGSGAATSEHPGQIVVIDFWATYCPPCIKSLPRLQVLQDRYAGKVHILAVSEDEELEVIPPFLSRTDVRLPVVWDKGKVMGDRYGVDSLPQTFVLDRKGVVRFVHLEYDEGELAALEAELRQLLAE